MGKLFHNIHQRLSSIYDSQETQAIIFLLLEKKCGLSKTDVLIGKDDCLNSAKMATINLMLERLEMNEPIQYVIGEADFYGLPIKVNRSTLIPRPETEELVDAVNNLSPKHILDIGTGSGCIALALKKTYPQAEVIAFDISNKAISVAQNNAKILNLDVTFFCQDIFKASPSKNTFDLIVSNPPYICYSEKKNMEQNVLNFEPESALFVDDDDPLLFYRTITNYAKIALTNNGVLAFEINQRYGQEVANLMKQNGFTDVFVRKDSFNNYRIVIGCLSRKK